MATEQTQTQQAQPAPAQTAVQPQPESSTPTVRKDNAPAKTKAVDKSLVTASIKQLPQILAPLAGCFDNAWGSFVKAYGDNAGQIMAREIDYATQALVATLTR